VLSPPYSTEITNAWSYTPNSPYVFMAWCLIKHRHKQGEQKVARCEPLYWRNNFGSFLSCGFNKRT
jgi:hypothetical protein